MKRLLAGLLLLLATAAHAASFSGTVSYVTDGDTLWVRPAAGGAPVQIRLLDLDAPESCQTFGPQARHALRERLLHAKVHVRTRGRDDYGRRLAHVTQDGQDVGAWMVRSGYAWSMSFRGKSGRYAQLEAQARLEGRGLWAAQALEPRQFRKRHGRCS